MKLFSVDYVGEISKHIKFGWNLSARGQLVTYVKYTLSMVLLLLRRIVQRIFTLGSSNDARFGPAG